MHELLIDLCLNAPAVILGEGLLKAMRVLGHVLETKAVNKATVDKAKLFLGGLDRAVLDSVLSSLEEKPRCKVLKLVNVQF